MREVAIRTGIGRLCSTAGITVSMVLACVSGAGAWLPCERSFQFMGIEVGDTTAISFYESSWGDCVYHQLHRVIIGPGDQFVRDEINSIPDTAIQQLRESSRNSRLCIRRLHRMDSVFSSPVRGWGMCTVRAPKFDSSFWSVWEDSLPSRQSVDESRAWAYFTDVNWLRDHIDEPVIDEPSYLIYYFPEGLYKNFSIADVIMVDDRYLFILTQQPMTVDGWTLDGLMIYRLKGK